MRTSTPSNVRQLISKRIEKYGLPQSWERECYDLCEKFLQSRSKDRVERPARLIDSVLMLLCRRYRFIEPKGLKKATARGRGSSKKQSLHYFRILEELNGVTPATPEEYVKRFFIDNPEYDELLPKALDIASKLPIRDFQMKSPRILASACIYVASIEETSNGYKPSITQTEVATFFRASTMSVRNIYKELIPKLKDMNTMLSKQEIEWWLSLRKNQLERYREPIIKTWQTSLHERKEFLRGKSCGWCGSEEHLVIHNAKSAGVQYVMVMCRRCHLAAIREMVLCRVCGKRYHRRKHVMCWKCLDVHAEKGHRIAGSTEPITYVHPWCGKMFPIESELLDDFDTEPSECCISRCDVDVYVCKMAWDR